MNQAFDYNGHVVAPSMPKKVLRTVKKTISIDAADRDQTKYYTNGDWIVYLPRTYTNVVSIRLKSAVFLNGTVLSLSNPGTGMRVHEYSAGPNLPSTDYSNDQVIQELRYILLDIEGLNKCDECAIGGNKSTFPDGYFAKIPFDGTTFSAPLGGGGETTVSTPFYIKYNDASEEENICKYSPPISQLDRLHLRTRLHSQQGNQGFIYWTSDGDYAQETNRNAVSSYTLTFEIEYLENGFDDFSSFETRLR